MWLDEDTWLRSEVTEMYPGASEWWRWRWVVELTREGRALYFESGITSNEYEAQQWADLHEGHARAMVGAS